MPPNAAVLVFGAGAVGLLCAWMAMRGGASSVTVADIDRGRVGFAVTNGFAHRGYVVVPKRGHSIEERLETARQTALDIGTVQQAGSGTAAPEADVVFECTGAESCVQAGIYAAKAGGRVMLVGMGTAVQTLPLAAAALREVDLRGVFRYANTYGDAIRLVRERPVGVPDLEALVTHRFGGLDQAQAAFEMAGRTADHDGNLVLKVVIEMGAE